MIGEDGAEDGGGGGVVVVGVVGMVEGHFLRELVVVVVLEGHDCVNDDEAVSRSCLYTAINIFRERKKRGRERERRTSMDVEVEGAFISFFTFLTKILTNFSSFYFLGEIGGKMVYWKYYGLPNYK